VVPQHSVSSTYRRFVAGAVTHVRSLAVTSTRGSLPFGNEVGRRRTAWRNMCGHLWSFAHFGRMMRGFLIKWALCALERACSTAQIGRFQNRPASRGACAPVPRRYASNHHDFHSRHPWRIRHRRPARRRMAVRRRTSLRCAPQQ
jgi:hypothetical protein